MLRVCWIRKQGTSRCLRRLLWSRRVCFGSWVWQFFFWWRRWRRRGGVVQLWSRAWDDMIIIMNMYIDIFDYEDKWLKIKCTWLILGQRCSRVGTACRCMIRLFVVRPNDSVWRMRSRGRNLFLHCCCWDLQCFGLLLLNWYSLFLGELVLDRSRFRLLEYRGNMMCITLFLSCNHHSWNWQADSFHFRRDTDDWGRLYMGNWGLVLGRGHNLLDQESCYQHILHRKARESEQDSFI